MPALFPSEGLLLGRAWLPGFDHPRIVTVRDGQLVDITARGLATVQDITERRNGKKTTTETDLSP